MIDKSIEAVAYTFFGSTSPAAIKLASEHVEKLESAGFAVYKKKVFRHGRRPSTSVPITEAIKSDIKEMYRINPTLTQHELATLFNVNPGRVSEALNS